MIAVKKPDGPLQFAECDKTTILLIRACQAIGAIMLGEIIRLSLNIDTTLTTPEMMQCSEMMNRIEAVQKAAVA